MTVVHSNDITLNVQIDGEGTPLLLIMGIGAQLLHWPQGLVDTLVSEGFQCIRHDNRDVGLSQRMSGHVDVGGIIGRRLFGMSVRPPYTLSDMATDSLGVLDALGIDRAHVFGVSMGGMIAQRMAIDAPERMLSLTSMMSSPGRRRDSLVSLRAARALLRRPAITDVESYTDELESFLQAVGTPGEIRDREQLHAVCAQIYARGLSPDGFARQFAAIAADGDRSEALRQVRVPTLVLHGTSDPLIAPGGGKATADAIPGARFVGLEGMGHDLPSRFWPLIVREVADLAGRASGA